MAKVSYCTVGSNDLEKAKAFYDELLGSIEMKPFLEHPSGGRIYRDGPSLFGVLGPYDQQPATVGNGTMVGFNLDSAEQVSSFHAKALELGGTNEGDPGERMPSAHFAYFRDLDGNKACAYFIG